METGTIVMLFVCLALFVATGALVKINLSNEAKKSQSDENVSR